MNGGSYDDETDRSHRVLGDMNSRCGKRGSPIDGNEVGSSSCKKMKAPASRGCFNSLDGPEDESQESEDEPLGGYFARMDSNRTSIPSASNEADILSTREQLDNHPCSLRLAGLSGSPDLQFAGSDGGRDVGDLNSSVKECRCSFCLKAAYMWIDLHYQDTRGRLSAMDYSRRRARSLEEKLHAHDQMTNISPKGSEKSAELEFDLLQHFRSLFLHTEEAFVRETTQLNSSLLRQKELRDKCKRELETIPNKS